MFEAAATGHLLSGVRYFLNPRCFLPRAPSPPPRVLEIPQAPRYSLNPSCVLDSFTQLLPGQPDTPRVSSYSSHPRYTPSTRYLPSPSFAPNSRSLLATVTLRAPIQPPKPSASPELPAISTFSPVFLKAESPEGPGGDRGGRSAKGSGQKYIPAQEGAVPREPPVTRTPPVPGLLRGGYCGQQWVDSPASCRWVRPSVALPTMTQRQ